MQGYNNGTGMTSKLPVFIKFTGNTCAAVDGGLCALAELCNTRLAALVVCGDFGGTRCNGFSLLLSVTSRDSVCSTANHTHIILYATHSAAPSA